MSTTTGTLTTRFRSLFSGFGTHRKATEDHTASRVMNAVMQDLVGHSVHSDAPETGDFAQNSPENTPTSPADVDLSNLKVITPPAQPTTYVDAMIEAGDKDGLNRVGDTYMQSYLRSRGQDKGVLLSASQMYTNAALLGSMDGLSNLYDCHRHGLKTPVPQYQALFDLVDYTRQTPGASATKKYARLINQIGLPEAEAAELRDEIWTRTSQKYVRASQLEQQVTARPILHRGYTGFTSNPG